MSLYIYETNENLLRAMRTIRKMWACGRVPLDGSNDTTCGKSRGGTLYAITKHTNNADNR